MKNHYEYRIRFYNEAGMAYNYFTDAEQLAIKVRGQVAFFVSRDIILEKNVIRKKRLIKANSFEGL